MKRILVYRIGVILAMLLYPVVALPTTITAIAMGEVEPPQALFPATVMNVDFLIRGSRDTVPVVGDGANEITTWTFDVTGDPNFLMFDTGGLLASAMLTLTLTPRGLQIETDKVGIEATGLDLIATPIIQSLPLDVTSTVSFDLLDFYTSADVLGALTAPGFGEIPMRYQDDSVVSFAQLDLTSVPEPATLSTIAPGLFGLVFCRRRA